MTGKNLWKLEKRAKGTSFRVSSPFGLGDGGTLLASASLKPQIVLGLPGLKTYGGTGSRIMDGRIFRLDGPPYSHECLYAEFLGDGRKIQNIITADAQLEYQVCYEGDCGHFTRNAAFFNNGNVIAVYGKSDYIGRMNLEKLCDGTDENRLLPVFKRAMERHAKKETEYCPERLKNYSFEKIRELVRQLDPEFRKAFKALL